MIWLINNYFQLILAWKNPNWLVYCEKKKHSTKADGSSRSMGEKSWWWIDVSAEHNHTLVCVCARVRLMTMLMNQPFLFFLSLSISEEVKIQFLIQLNHVFDCIIIICLHEEDDKKSAHLSVWILDAYWEKQLNNTIFPFSMEWIERTLLTTFSYTQPLGFFLHLLFFWRNEPQLFVISLKQFLTCLYNSLKNCAAREKPHIIW